MGVVLVLICCFYLNVFVALVLFGLDFVGFGVAVVCLSFCFVGGFGLITFGLVDLW